MGPWPGPGMGLLRRGMEVGRPRPRMGVELQWLPSRLLARPLGPLPRHALSWASPKRRLAIGGPLHSNWADGSLVAARPPSPLPRARDVGRWRKVAGGGSIRGLRLASSQLSPPRPVVTILHRRGLGRQGTRLADASEIMPQRKLQSLSDRLFSSVLLASRQARTLQIGIEEENPSLYEALEDSITQCVREVRARSATPRAEYSERSFAACATRGSPTFLPLRRRTCRPSSRTPRR